MKKSYIIKDPNVFKEIINSLPENTEIEIENEESNEIKKITVKNLKKVYNSKKISVMGDGRIFSFVNEGIMPAFLREFFKLKVKVNSEIIKIGNEQNKNPKENFDYNSLLKQKDREYKYTKLILNSVYGQTGNRYSRWCSPACATSITTSGRFIIYQSEKFINNFFNNIYSKYSKKYWKKFYNEFQEKTNFYKDFDDFYKRISSINKIDRVVFVDTDSNGIVLGDVIYSKDKNYENKKSTRIINYLFGKYNEQTNDYEIELEENKLIEYILFFCKYIQDYLNELLEIEVKQNLFNSISDFKIEQKQEIIAKKGVILGKKKYALWVINKKGVKKDELSVTGLELIKADTAECVKKPIKNILKIILKSENLERDKEKIKKIVSETKKQIKKEDFINIGTGVNLNNLLKYDESRDFKEFIIPKGCPIHVRAALHYNDLISFLNLETSYELISEGNKIFYIPVKPISIVAIQNKIYDLAFIEDLPKEFLQHVEIDYKRLIDKIFLDKLRIIISKIDLEDTIDIKQSLIKSIFKKKINK